MKIKEVPQDDNQTFRGYGTKALYAVDESGRYTRIPTNGWEVEEVVLRDVINDFAASAQEAKARAVRGETSPVEYFMKKYFMDLSTLATSMGLARWRVKRHFNPKVFSRLNHRLLERYAELFHIDVAALKNFSEHI